MTNDQSKMQTKEFTRAVPTLLQQLGYFCNRIDAKVGS